MIPCSLQLCEQRYGEWSVTWFPYHIAFNGSNRLWVVVCYMAPSPPCNNGGKVRNTGWLNTDWDWDYSTGCVEAGAAGAQWQAPC